MTGIKVNGTIIRDHAEGIGEDYLMYLKSLRIEDGTIFIETRDNAKVVIDGQPVPKRCCGNCKYSCWESIERDESSEEDNPGIVWCSYRKKYVNPLTYDGIFNVCEGTDCEFWEEENE